MTLFLFSAIPAAILSFIVSRKFEIHSNVLKPGMLFILFGILSGVIVSLLNFRFPSLNQNPSGVIDTLMYTIFKVGLIEESGKFLLFQFGLFFIISEELKTRNVIILFSVMTGLGFALIENFSYASNYGIGVLISRSLIAMPMHMCCGFLLGWFLTSSIKYKVIIAISAASLLHGIYDFWAFSGFRILAILTFVVSMQFMFIEINKLKANGK
jgi:RsiW-degrading membrane proteinase PrsW (M82 family)